ncbi:MAG: AAA family ATPase [Deltaproteobacteria bacterium]|nr:AAA family ATPase [Deltaproteobacteria bacterium]
MRLPHIVEELLKPSAHPDAPQNIELKQTHISYLIFTPQFVYKIKKPVDFGFLDFTTLEKRRFFCEQEVVLNKRLCPDMYLGVVAIKEKNGIIKIQGSGEAIEYAVKMKKLPSENMMDVMLKRGSVTDEMIVRMAKLVTDFHNMADTNPYISEFGKITAIKKNTDENFSQTLPIIGKTISQERYDRIKNYAESFLQEHKKAFENRIENGFIKDCHGDIHSEDICITNGIYIFDCIEFNERFRYSDTVSDIAFLAMDLDFFNCHNLSKRFIDAYIKASKGDSVFEILDFYKCYRAYVRGKVEGFKSQQKEVAEAEREHAIIKAKRYFYLADLYAAGGFRPVVLVVCGLAGTGKTTLANAIGKEIGFKVISSDIVRKELAGIRPAEHRYDDFEKGIYTRDFTIKTYNEMMKKAEDFLRGGISIILDATFMADIFREMTVKLAKDTNADLYFIECTLDDEIVKKRLDERSKKEGVASDARWEIYLKQKEEYKSLQPSAFSPQPKALIIDTDDEIDKIKSIVIDKVFE